MTPDYDTVAEFLRRLGHPVAIVGRNPVNPFGKSTVLWPQDQSDTVDEVCGIARDYHATYVNLNPLVPDVRDMSPDLGTSVRNAMIARRTRILIDVDAHDLPKEMAREQKDAIKARLGEPLIETDSGNGYGLIYTCNLPNDYASSLRVKEYLKRLQADFSCVDDGVFTAGRLTRVAGTFNRCRVTGERIPTRLLN